jgi:hypothetical protein
VRCRKVEERKVLICAFGIWLNESHKKELIIDQSVIG